MLHRLCVLCMCIVRRCVRHMRNFFCPRGQFKSCIAPVSFRLFVFGAGFGCAQRMEPSHDETSGWSWSMWAVVLAALLFMVVGVITCMSSCIQLLVSTCRCCSGRAQKADAGIVEQHSAIVEKSEVRKRVPFTKEVFFTEKGSSWHDDPTCGAIKNSRTIYSAKKAVLAYQPCDKCAVNVKRVF